eukprot:CAMPEP_0175065058 /NCGR_PEP_ID=MMETSP0052_2-20121109/15694_1 /TAXON_ID=51329 ORGANISM="Polytomella parva, Strain SAG 63-3" /NCGR_SAMPLE_ID=MMETSP0052_2 /ASSEMBLY_ACC=CAM_ASM_000194 /LENGTH=557 /DNA_ID=CAMNT_0016331511 /DNA_START=200 /DNA_END=1870 /DNA_ORIENTATION=+
MSLLFFFFIIFNLTHPWTPSDYPNPFIDVNKCGRGGLKSWVCDPDGVLTKAGADVAEGIIKEIFAGLDPYALVDCGSQGHLGAQVALALMDEIVTNPALADDAVQAREMAKSLHAQWGVGDAVCDNGALLLLAVRNRQIYVSRGKALKERLNDDALDSVFDRMRPMLKEKNYDSAIEGAVVDLGLLIAGKAPSGGGGAGSDGGDDSVLGFLIFGGFFGFYLFISSRRWLAEGRQRKTFETKLNRLKVFQSAMRSRAFQSTSCPICMEDFSTASPPSTSSSPSNTVTTSNGAGGAGTSIIGSSSALTSSPTAHAESSSVEVIKRLVQRAVRDPMTYISRQYSTLRRRFSNGRTSSHTNYGTTRSYDTHEAEEADGVNGNVANRMHQRIQHPLPQQEQRDEAMHLLSQRSHSLSEDRRDGSDIDCDEEVEFRRARNQNQNQNQNTLSRSLLNFDETAIINGMDRARGASTNAATNERDFSIPNLIALGETLQLREEQAESGEVGDKLAKQEQVVAAEAPDEHRIPFALPCGHLFCEPCIRKWVDSNKTTCPICRKPMDD